MAGEKLLSPHNGKKLMSRSGYTLLEMLIVLGLLSILSSIAVIQYRDSRQDTEKRNLKDSALLYATRVDTCIKVVGGWPKYRNKRTGETCDHGKTQDPCKVMCKEVSSTTPSPKLNYTCPAGATCEFFTHGTPTRDVWRYHCLSIKKTVSGKKLQVVTVIPYDNPSDYQIWCAELSGEYVRLAGHTCKASHPYGRKEGQGKQPDFKNFANCWKQDP